MLCVEGRLGKKRRQCEVREVREWRGVRQSTGVSLFSSGAVGFSSQKTIGRTYYSQKKPIYNARCEEVRHRGEANPSPRRVLGWGRGGQGGGEGEDGMNEVLWCVEWERCWGHGRGTETREGV